nr:uncharacterized protein CTRU02_11148 [Colletotrichum truncatum]KAF6786277.1 hypothetical protein CTRU02_11148 [Colletotrichum truncatum]
MSFQAARLVRQLPRRPMPAFQTRSMSMNSFVAPKNGQSQPGDWPGMGKKAVRRVAEYVGFASAVLFWPYPVYRISEAIWGS